MHYDLRVRLRHPPWPTLPPFLGSYPFGASIRCHNTVTCRTLSGLVCCDEKREYDDGAEVLPGGVIEGAAARYQAQAREAGRAVKGFRREIGFRVLPYTGDAENARHPVGEPHVDEVSGAQCTQAEEDGGPLIVVDVTFDDRRPDLAGGHRVLVPACRAGLSV